MIVIYGGTFNPIHNGHLALAKEVLEAFKLDTVEFMPSYLPVHRGDPEVSASIRSEMVQLAINCHSNFNLNTIEIARSGPSFAFDTLSEIKERYPLEGINWLMGSDSFNSFLSWKNPQGILKLANLIVCSRPDIETDKSIFPENHLADTEKLANYASGKIIFHQMKPNRCSSTQIRKKLKTGGSVARCLPQSVLEFINLKQLYNLNDRSNT